MPIDNGINLNTGRRVIRLPEVVGRGYRAFWQFRGRWRVVKGSRRSKKSKTAALWYIVNMMAYPQANTLVVRKTYRTLHDSCFTELKWAIHRLGVDAWWTVKESPLEMTYTPTGQKIYFRGLDDPLKVTSIAAEVGVLSWMWIEEAYEITDEGDFDTLCESMLGDCPEGLFKQITLTFNPWNERHWIKRRFFDSPSPDVLALTTNYLCNEWLSPDDRRVFEDMAERNPRRYKVAGLGEWGVSEGLVYQNWREESFDIAALRAKPEVRSVFGLDFGYVADPSALFCGLVDKEARCIYVFDEMYKRGMTNEEIADTIIARGYAKETITADCAEPKSIDRIRSLGVWAIKAARKGADSIRAGIDFIQDYAIIVHPKCANFLSEISSYSFKKDRYGQMQNAPEDANNHLMDAMRYAMEDVARDGATPGKIFLRR